MTDMGARTPQPPAKPEMMMPGDMVQLVPSTVIVSTARTDTDPAVKVVFRAESLNGSWVLGWSPDEARNIARLLLRQADLAAQQESGLTVPSLGNERLDRLIVPE